jgi:hypothetical protein
MGHTHHMNEVSLRTACMGYLYAVKRIDDATARAAATTPYFRGEVFIPLIETLNWLDMILDRPEVEHRVEPDMKLAFKFARGRSHHAWAEAIEFRNDVPLPQPPAVTLATGHVAPLAPLLVSDWCWRQPEELPGSKRPGHTKGKNEYRRLLAGRQARATLNLMIEVVGTVGLGIAGV